MVTLKYKDEKDRAYGLGGMTVCMLLMDNEGFIDSVNLDAPADCGMVFSPDFYYVDNTPKPCGARRAPSLKLLQAC